MALARDIIRRALRLIGVLRSGAQPGGSDASDGLERLQGLILAMPGLNQNGRWNEVSVKTGTYSAHPGDRVTVTLPGVVTLPALIDPLALNWDWGNYGTQFGWDGLNPRPPLDLTRVMIIGGANPGTWLYSATKGAWAKANGLAIGTELPFGPEDDGGLAAQLAVTLAEEYGLAEDVGPRTVALAAQSARAIKARMAKAAPFDWSRPNARVSAFRDYW